jgi:hypothetical protein
MIYFISILLYFLFLETIFWILSKRINKSLPFFINIPYIRSRIGLRNTVLALAMKHYMVHDANLGYRMKANCKPFRLLRKIPGLKRRFKEIKIKNYFEISTDSYGFIKTREDQNINYQELANNKRIFKILASGNSITAGYGVKSGKYTWPAVLEQLLIEDGLFRSELFDSVVVINSSSLGNQISQEFKMFVDETIYLKPNLVVALSGGNMGYDYIGTPSDLALHEQQKIMENKANFPWYLRQKILIPSTICWLKEHGYLSKYYNTDRFPQRKSDYLMIKAGDLTVQRIKQFYGICQNNGIGYIFCQQPGMGIGHKEYTKEESTFIKYFERYFFNLDWDTYVEIGNKYYNDVDAAAKNLPYYHNFVNIFDNIKETIYSDTRHQNELGHEIIAKRMMTIIKDLYPK